MSTKYTPEFKEQAVALYLKSSTTYAAVARKLGCDPGSLSDWIKSDWIKKATSADGSKEDNPLQIAEEIRQLRRENARLRKENEILLKASAFFASKRLWERRSSSS
ncbi:MAG: transposase [Atopobiaceae bacterium]|nr:transposase [Atopobiaceae bacterium]